MACVYFWVSTVLILLKLLNNGVCFLKFLQSLFSLTIAQQWLCIFEVSTVPLFLLTIVQQWCVFFFEVLCPSILLKSLNNGVSVFWSFIPIFLTTAQQYMACVFLVSQSLYSPKNRSTMACVFFSFYSPLFPTIAQQFMCIFEVSMSSILPRIAQQWRVCIFEVSLSLIPPKNQQWRVFWSFYCPYSPKNRSTMACVYFWSFYCPLFLLTTLNNTCVFLKFHCPLFS
jgi:hypothetical protein